MDRKRAALFHYLLPPQGALVHAAVVIFIFDDIDPKTNDPS
jgi:hypothetical protein